MSETTRMKRVMDLAGEQPFQEFVTFELPDEDDPMGLDFTSQIHVSKVDWTDLGEPDTLTVTIEPGDTLTNDEDLETAVGIKDQVGVTLDG